MLKQKKKPASIIILTRDYDGDSKFVDVSHLQSLKENRYAVFQVASNFNGVEAISDESSPDNISFTENYTHDRTQGPAASVSCGGAAITRVHAAFFEINTNSESWKQTRDHQVEFLGHEKLKNHFPVKNGYVCLPQNGEEDPFPSIDTPEYGSLLGVARIGLHKNAQVTSGQRAFKMHIVTDPEQIVDQVFCAAVNIGQGYSGMINRKSSNCEMKCSFALDLAYEGVYLSAIANKRKKIFLTLIGGGVFGNSKKLIFTAIIRAHNKYANSVGSLIESVSVVLYSSQDFYKPVLVQLEESDIPHKLIVYSGSNPVVKKNWKCDE